MSESTSGGSDGVNPELIFGLVGPLGADLELVGVELTEALRQVGYDIETIPVSRLMCELKKEPWKSLPERGPEDKRLESYMDAGNALRKAVGRADALALLAIGAIREQRESRLKSSGSSGRGTAFILRSLKTPEEVRILKRIYGPTFFLISAYAPRQKRVRNLAKRIADSNFSQRIDEFIGLAEGLVTRDEKEAEAGQKWGQNVLETFPLADVIVNIGNPPSLRTSLVRFVQLIFGNPFHTPSRDEQGITLAFGAALRSGSLARQVGAAICREDGSVIAIGTNEVPRPGGGLYWAGHENDGRDFLSRRDSSDAMREKILADIIDRLSNAGWLADERKNARIQDLVKECLREGDPPVMKGAVFLATIDYVRAVHAEMASLMDAARHGVSTVGGVLYTTTFPCHDCAKHIIAAGIRRVVYVEPYPKSLVQDFYRDSVLVDSEEKCSPKVQFEPFVGVGPTRFEDLFRLGDKKRKNKDGTVAVWRATEARAHLVGYVPSSVARLAAEREEIHRFQSRMTERGLWEEPQRRSNDTSEGLA